VSRISAGRLALNRESINFVDVVEEVLDRVSEEARRAGSDIVLRAPDSLVGSWDRNRLDQVVTNLVTNAIKYAGGKPIEIRLGSQDGVAQLAVQDHGPGINEADQKRIFEQFERAVTPAFAGFGLGLWIARSIVEAHGGRIEVASALGQGATFTVVLPDGRPE
jgi:signal transduction histidine kinase